MKRYTALVWTIRLFKALAWFIASITVLGLLIFLVQQAGITYRYDNWLLSLVAGGGMLFAFGMGMALISYGVGEFLDMQMHTSYSLERMANIQTEFLRAYLQQQPPPRLADDAAMPAQYAQRNSERA